MSLNSSFVCTASNSNDRCILCNETFSTENRQIKNEPTIISERGTLDKYSSPWEALDARVCDVFPYNEFRNASDRLKLNNEQKTFVVHNSCHVSIRTRLGRKQTRQENYPLSHKIICKNPRMNPW